MSEFVAVGKVKDAHGLKGELYISLFSKEASWLKRMTEIRLVSGANAGATNKSLGAVASLAAPVVSVGVAPVTPMTPMTFKVKSARPHKEGLIVLSPDINGRTEAENLKGRLLEIPTEFLVSAKGEAIFLIEILNFEVNVEGRGVIGTITDFSSNIAQDLLVVSDQRVIYEIPFVGAFVRKIDYKARRVEMQLPRFIRNCRETCFCMTFQVLTLFPDMIHSACKVGVVGQAVQGGVLHIETVNPRDFAAQSVHQPVDDRPFGGGDGMVMMPEPLMQALESIRARTPEIHENKKRREIFLSAHGRPLTDGLVRELAATTDNLVLICGRYGGVDQRFLNASGVEEISVGDYILSGGELAALIIIDAVSRLLPGVLGNQKSHEDESFVAGLLEYPQYTRPREWRGALVPEALFSGHHAKILQWRQLVRILKTADCRPDLMRELTLSHQEIESACRFIENSSADELKQLGLQNPTGVVRYLRSYLVQSHQEGTI